MTESRQIYGITPYAGPEVEHNRYLAAINAAFGDLGSYLNYANGAGGIGSQLLKVLGTKTDHFLGVAQLPRSSAQIGYAILNEELSLAYLSNGVVSPLTREQFKKLMLSCEDDITLRPEFRQDGILGLFRQVGIDSIVHEALGTKRKLNGAER